MATWAALSGSSTIMVRKNVAEILTNHVTFELEAIDRMYLNAYVPSLQTGGGFVWFVKTQLGARVPSTMMVAPMSQQFVDAIERFVDTEGVDLVTFEKGQRTDDVAQPYLASFEGEEGVLFVGKAQEKASVFRTEKRRDASRSDHRPSRGPAGCNRARAESERRRCDSRARRSKAACDSRNATAPATDLLRSAHGRP
jgi:hypothetical protein